jgi:hypothetical protein
VSLAHYRVDNVGKAETPQPRPWPLLGNIAPDAQQEAALGKQIGNRSPY